MMDAINAWAECILATVILIGLVEIIVPEGQMRKFVFLITGIVTSVVIATPIIKIFSKDFNLDDVFYVENMDDNFYYIDTLRSTVDRQAEILGDVFADNIVKEFNDTYVDMEISECNIFFSYDDEGKITEVKEVEIICKNKVDDIYLLKRRISDICEVTVEKVRVS